MSKKEKLLQRLFQKPKDFKWSELCTLLAANGFEVRQGTGARVKLVHRETKKIISIHKPHPENILLLYVLEEVIEALKDMGIEP